MERALFHAARGRGRTSPNPLVGAVVVSADGVVVGQGFHERAGEPHAEVHALDEAGARARGATLYCTLEPCCHHGPHRPVRRRGSSTPASRASSRRSRIRIPLVRGRGFAFLRDARRRRRRRRSAPSAAVALNQPFFTLMREGRPFVILKAATSLDGCIAAAPGAADAADVGRRRTATRTGVRAEVDAIGVGVGTILADDPLLTARGAYPRAAADARHFRPPAAHAAAARACSRHATPGLSSS